MKVFHVFETITFQHVSVPVLMDSKSINSRPIFHQAWQNESGSGQEGAKEMRFSLHARASWAALSDDQRNDRIASEEADEQHEEEHRDEQPEQEHRDEQQHEERQDDEEHAVRQGQNANGQ